MRRHSEYGGIFHPGFDRLVGAQSLHQFGAVHLVLAGGVQLVLTLERLLAGLVVAEVVVELLTGLVVAEVVVEL